MTKIECTHDDERDLINIFLHSREGVGISRFWSAWRLTWSLAATSERLDEEGLRVAWVRTGWFGPVVLATLSCALTEFILYSFRYGCLKKYDFITVP